MKRIYVFGTGITSRQIRLEYESVFGNRVAGFLCASGEMVDGTGKLDGLPITPFEEMALRPGSERLDILIGEPNAEFSFPEGQRQIVTLRRNSFLALLESRHQVIGFKHPGAAINEYADIHPTAIILNQAFVEPLSQISWNSILRGNAYLTQASYVGPHSILGESVLVAGQTRVNSKSYLEEGAILRSGITLHSRCVIQAGSVIQTDVLPDQIALAAQPRPLKMPAG